MDGYGEESPRSRLRDHGGGPTTARGRRGALAGLAGGVYFAKFVESFLYETEPLSVSSVGLPVIGLVIAAVGATWTPMRHAIRVDPVEALRTD